MLGRFALLLFVAVPLFSQTPCEGTPAYSPCEIVFELSAADLAAHPNPYATAQLHAEFRSPHFKTYSLPPFWDGARKLIIRFTPTEGGQWTYRTTSNIAAFDAKDGTFNAGSSDFSRLRKRRQFPPLGHRRQEAAPVDGLRRGSFRLPEPAGIRPARDAEAAQNKFTHFRGSIGKGPRRSQPRLYRSRQTLNSAYFDELDRRVLAVHKRGLTIDLILASNPDYITSLFPDWQSRDRFISYAVARAMRLFRTLLGRVWRSSRITRMAGHSSKSWGWNLKKQDFTNIPDRPAPK